MQDVYGFRSQAWSNEKHMFDLSGYRPADLFAAGHDDGVDLSELWWNRKHRTAELEVWRV
jgi:hypothetical protein